MQKVRLAHSINVALMAAACFSSTVLGAQAPATTPNETGDAATAAATPEAQTPAAAPAAAPASDKATELEGISVSGFGASLGKANSIKQTADTIVDAVSAEDVGKFPDINLAESLQRITGVQITRLSADGTTANEGQNISVRGLPSDFNYVSLNGASIASSNLNLVSPGASRTFNFSVLPSDFISSLEVYKSPKADLTEGGIAATIDLKTLMPLDIGKEMLKGSVGLQQTTGLNDKTPNVSVVYNNVFADKTFGITLGASWDRRKYLNSTWTSAQLDTGLKINGTPGYTELDSIAIKQTQDTLDTKTFYAALQYRPATDLDFSLVAIRAKTNESELQPSFTIRPQYSANALSYTVDPSGVVTNLNSVNNYYEIQNFQTWNTNTLSTLAFKAQWRPGNWEIGAGIDYSNARAVSQQIGIDTQAFNAKNPYSGGYDIIPGQPIASFVLDPKFNINDPNNYPFYYAGGNFYNLSDIIRAGKIDLTYRFDEGFIQALKFGVRYQQEVNSNNAQTFQNFDRYLAYPITPYTSPWNLGRVMGGYSGGALVPRIFPYINPQQYLNQNFGGTLQGFVNAPGTQDRGDPTNLYSVTEDAKAAYAMAEYKFDTSIPIHGNFGARFVSTKESVVDNTYDLNAVKFINPPPVSGATYIAPPFTPISVNHSYSDVLPSFNLTADLRDDLFLRFAAAEVMSRPTLTALIPKYAINWGGVGSSNNTLASGNPELNPFKAKQFDLSLEYYFGTSSTLSAAYFYKDIDSFIQTQNKPITIQGFQFVNTLPINSSGGHVKGIEANYVQLFDFLPGLWSGFGVQVNATWAIGSTDPDTVNNIPAHTFQNLSKWTGNASVFWEKDGWSARVSYNYRSKYLYLYNLRGQGTNQYGDQFATFDAQVSYQINPHFTVFAEGSNLLGREQIFSMTAAQGSTFYPLTWISGDRRVTIGGRFGF